MCPVSMCEVTPATESRLVIEYWSILGACTVWLGKVSSPFTLRHSPLFTQRLSILYLPSRYIYLRSQKIPTVNPTTKYPHLPRPIRISYLHTEQVPPPCTFRDRISNIHPATHLWFSQRQRSLFIPCDTDFSVFPPIVPSVYPVRVFSLSPIQSPLFIHRRDILQLPTDAISSI
jgi:hypothetical protein